MIYAQILRHKARCSPQLEDASFLNRPNQCLFVLLYAAFMCTTLYSRPAAYKLCRVTKSRTYSLSPYCSRFRGRVFLVSVTWSRSLQSSRPHSTVSQDILPTCRCTVITDRQPFGNFPLQKSHTFNSQSEGTSRHIRFKQTC